MSNRVGVTPGSPSNDVQATASGPSLVEPSALRRLLELASASPADFPEMTSDVRLSIERALAGAGAAEHVELEALGSTRAVVGRLLGAAERMRDDGGAATAIQPRDAFDGRPPRPAAADPEPSRPFLDPARPGQGVSLQRGSSRPAFSVFNDRGQSGAGQVWDTIGFTREALLDRREVRSRQPGIDPAGVLRRGQAVQSIQSLVMQRARGEVIAKALLDTYGPYDASNTPENRQAILDSLSWIAGYLERTGYDSARAAADSTDTHSPNKTLTGGRGVCRDIHTAVASIAASLMNSQQSADGTRRLGEPVGREDSVQVFSYATPTEFHSYPVIRDPATGRWNAIEYGKNYLVAGETAADAARSLPGYMSGAARYTLRGWDERPVINDRIVLAGSRAVAFMEDNPGVGLAEELRISASPDDLRATYFVAPGLSITGSVDPMGLNDGIRGGVKLNYHTDLVDAQGKNKGYARIAGGVYTDFFDASMYTGWRDEAWRARYQVYVFAVQADGRYELDPKQLIGDHLEFHLGADWKARLGVPVADGPRSSGFMMGALGDYSAADVGVDASLRGREQLARTLELEWKLGLRADVDLINVGTEYITGDTVERSLLQDPLRADFGMALTHRADSGLLTRFEIGGTQFLSKPYDGQATPTERHYGLVTIAPESGDVTVGLVARGETIDGKHIPVNALGVAFDWQARQNELSFGVGAESVFPDGNFKNIGDNLRVTANVKLLF